MPVCDFITNNFEDNGQQHRGTQDSKAINTQYFKYSN